MAKQFAFSVRDKSKEALVKWLTGKICFIRGSEAQANGTFEKRLAITRRTAILRLMLTFPIVDPLAPNGRSPTATEVVKNKNHVD